MAADGYKFYDAAGCRQLVWQAERCFFVEVSGLAVGDWRGSLLRGMVLCYDAYRLECTGDLSRGVLSCCGKASVGSCLDDAAFFSNGADHKFSDSGICTGNYDNPGDRFADHGIDFSAGDPHGRSDLRLDVPGASGGTAALSGHPDTALFYGCVLHQSLSHRLRCLLRLETGIPNLFAGTLCAAVGSVDRGLFLYGTNAEKPVLEFVLKNNP